MKRYVFEINDEERECLMDALRGLIEKLEAVSGGIDEARKRRLLGRLAGLTAVE